MDLKAAFSGGFAAVAGYVSYILNINPTEIATETLVKLGMTVIIGFVGGIVGMASKDFYNKYIKALWKR